MDEIMFCGRVMLTFFCTILFIAWVIYGAVRHHDYVEHRKENPYATVGVCAWLFFGPMGWARHVVDNFLCKDNRGKKF